jgi:hypothetical protein
MANALVDLVSLQEAKDYFAAAGQTAPTDASLAILITGISSTIQSYLSRNLVSQAYAVTLNGDGGYALSLPNTPITDVGAVAIDGVPISKAVSPIAPGFVFSDTQVMVRGYRFSRGVQNIALAYTAGFTTIPDDIKRAVFEALSAVVAVFDYDDPRAVEIAAGGTKIKLASGSVVELASICITADVTSKLNQRRRVVPC